MLFVSVTAFSQQFTDANMPVIGDNIDCMANYDMSIFSPGDGGEGITWDFTTDTYPDDLNYSFVEVAGTPYANEFPNATICGITEEDTYQYYNTLSGKLSIAGLGSSLDAPAPNDKLLAYFDPEINQFDLPLAFGTKHNSSYSGKYVLGGNEFPVSGTVSSEVDGSGTIITPAGTFNNVLRIHVQISETGLVGQQVDQYLYVSQDHRYWIALHEQVSVSGDVNIQKWYSANPPVLTQSNVSIDSEMINVKIYPNPAQDNITVNSKNIINSLKIYNSLGKVVFVTADLNSLNYSINVDDFVSGIYNIVTSEKDGTIRTTKFIKK